MKTTNSILFAALAALSLSIACSKEQNIGSPEKVQTAASESGKTITINATLPDATKVNFEAGTDDAGKAKLILTWSQNDKLRVYDASNRDSYTDFDLTRGAGTKVATFSGTAPEAISYNVAVINNATATQEQASDGDTGHLVYGASASGLSLEELKTIQFTSISSVLGLTAKLPANVTETITSVNITASNDIFYSGKELNISIKNSTDTANDGLLKVFATMPMGDQTIPAGTELLIKFNSNNDKHKVYTRYYKFEADKTLIGGRLNELRMDCSKTDQHAGLVSCKGSSEEDAYLIGDQYQMAQIENLASSTKKYFKLIDDFSADNWTTSLNVSGERIVELDGNNKTITGLDAPLFYDFNGKAKSLKIVGANLSGLSDVSGIFACYIKTGDSVIEDVDISDSSISSNNKYTGGLIGQANKNISLSGVDITKTNVSGGLTAGIIGYTNNSIATISECSYSGGTITANGQYAGGIIAATYKGKNTTISDCSVKDAIITSAYNRVGGVVGDLREGATVERTTVGEDGEKVTIKITGTAASYTGGFVGLMEGGEIKDNCKSFVSVTGVKTQIGGFIGCMQGGKVSNCESHGEVNGPGTIGGFFGEVTGATKIENNASFCAVTATSTYVGGFAGRLAGSISCSKCHHKDGDVSSNLSSAEAYVGGFAGYIGNKTEPFTGTISDCTVERTKTECVLYEGTSAKSSGHWVGGFAGGIGHNTSANNTGIVEKCKVYNSPINGGQYTGGFAGVSYSRIEQCVVNGKPSITGYAASLGGLLGYQAGNHVKYCYSNATLRHNDKTNVGGLIGRLNGSTVEECYSAATITFTGSTHNNENSCGGIVGSAAGTNSISKLIRWWPEDSGEYGKNIIGGETTVHAGCYVKTLSDNNFKSVATTIGWSTDGTMWKYPDDGGIPSLVNVP